MPELEPPTLGEVMRQLDRVLAQLAQIAVEMKQDRADAAKIYVRQDLYLANRQADGAVVADLHGDITKNRAEVDSEIEALKATRERDALQRRQMQMWLGGITVTLLLGLAGLVVSIMTLVR